MKKTFLSAVLAGIAIALGAAVNIAVGGGAIGAALFSIGLFCVCFFQCDLFTGKVPFADTAEKIKKLPVIWFGNMVGAMASGALISISRMSIGTFSGATAVMESKLVLPYAEIFVSAVFCNVLIYIAVVAYKAFASSARYIMILLGVMVFVLCGFDHCVADAAYAAIAGVISGFSKRFIISSAMLLITATAGNACGGVLIKMLHKAACK